MGMAVGTVEFNSIAAGVAAGDCMLKTAQVQLLSAQPVCPGKYIVAVSGDTAGVKVAVEAGERFGAEHVVDSLVIANIHPDVIRAVAGTADVRAGEAVGVIETYSLCASITAADCAVKAADIDLIEVRLGRGLGGKSFVVLTGNVADVTAAADAAKAQLMSEGMLLNTEVIPALHPDMMAALL